MPKVPDLAALAHDPSKLFRLMWPRDSYYQKQVDVYESVWFNKKTVVPAGNMLGKDFIAGRIVAAAVVSRNPVRIVTTSAKENHLNVLWGEINDAIRTCAFPLRIEDGGVLRVTDKKITKLFGGRPDPVSYVVGMVASPDTMAAMQGHHVKQVGDGIWRTLFVADEASSVPDDYHKMAQSWYHRALIIGNTWPCSNFFYRDVEGVPGGLPGGDIPRSSGRGYLRKVIHITADDSPNVRYAKAQIAAGKEPDDRILVAGVKPWGTYREEIQTFDPQELSVSHDAKFYKGAEILMFPPGRLSNALKFFHALRDRITSDRTVARFRARAVGIDPGEGGDNTAFVAGEERGVTDWRGYKTPDTNRLFHDAVAFVEKNDVPGDMVFIDRGGGGKQLADRMRAEAGLMVRTVSFGEPASPPVRTSGGKPVDLRTDDHERRTVYKNRRAQMYGTLMDVLDPDGMHASTWGGFGIPPTLAKVLFPQLSPIPKVREKDGVLTLPPKNRSPGLAKNVKTLIELIGHSPDEADALALLVYGLFVADPTPVAGVLTYPNGDPVLTSQSSRQAAGQREVEVVAGTMYDPLEGFEDPYVLG